MKKISLKKLYESGTLPAEQFPTEQQPGMDRKAFMESLKRFSQYSQHIYGSKKLKEITTEIRSLVEAAEQVTLKETDQWFDNVTVSRHMKQLKESYKLFEKTASEMGQLQQRLESCYEDIGKNLNNYWDVE